MPQNIKLYKAANDIVIEVGPGRKILPTTDSSIDVVVDRPVLRFNLTSEHLTARAGTASNEIEITSATGQVVIKDIDHARLRRSNGNTWGSTRDAVVTTLNGSTLFGATLVDTRITTNANDISDVESDISTIQTDITGIESDVLSLSKALKFTADDRGVFLDDGKALTSSFLRIQPGENKLQTGSTGNTFYSSTESSPGEHRFAVQAGASGSETSITSLLISGSSSAAKATATFGATTALIANSTLSVSGNTTLKNLAFDSTGSPHSVSFNNATVTGLAASSIDSGTFANARISSASVLQHADNYGSWNLKTGGVQRTTVSSGGDLNLVGGTGITLAYSAGGTVTITSSASSFDGAFSSLTGTPTTIAGYGITDALELGSTSSTALAGDTTTITTAQANAITANTAKTSFPGFGTTAGTALEGDTALLQLGTTSSTALAGDTTTITTAQANAITANTAKTTFPGFGTTAGTALEGDTSLFSGAFGDLTGKPTTISGYGITDAFDGSAGSLTGTLDMARIATDAITGAKIAHNTLDAIHINASAIGASELNVAGNGTSGQLLASDGDGTFSWVNAVSDTNTNISNADLTLDSDHLVTLDGNELTFRSSSTQNQETLVIADDGTVTIGSGSGPSGATLAIREAGGNGANYVGLQAPDSLTSSPTFTLPSADGSNGQVLSTNGSGTLSFTTISDTNTNIGNTDLTLSQSRKFMVGGYDFGIYDTTTSGLFTWDDSADSFTFHRPVLFKSNQGYTAGEVRLAARLVKCA